MAHGGPSQLPSLDWDHKDESYTFTEWQDFMNSYFVINAIADEMKWHYILLSSGRKGHELWQSWALVDADKKDPEKVFKKFKDHLVGTPNKWVMRLELAALAQQDGENVDDFICRVKSKANECMFTSTAIRDEQISFQIIKGICWNEQRKRLISKGNDLTLEKIIESCQAFQATLQNTVRFKGDQVKSVETMVRSHGPVYKFCNSNHPPRRCPAYRKSCNRCDKMKYFASSKMCKGSNSQGGKPTKVDGRAGGQGSGYKSQQRGRSKSRDRNTKHVHEVTTVPDNDEILDCGTLVLEVSESDIQGGERQAIFAKLNVRPPDVKCKVTLNVKADTGANGNVLPLRCLRQIYHSISDPTEMLHSSRAKLRAVNGSTVEHLGYIVFPIQFEDSEWEETTFFVTDIDGPAILSCGICERIGIVSVVESSNISDGPYVMSVVGGGCSQRDQAIADVYKLAGVYPERFSGIGGRPGKFHIELKPDVPGTVAP